MSERHEETSIRVSYIRLSHNVHRCLILDILTIKGMIDSLTIDANADANTILKAFNIIEDNWKLVPSLTQTEAAKIKHAIAFPT